MKKHLAALASVIALACAPAYALSAEAPMASADPAVVEATRQMFSAMKLRETMVRSMAQLEQQLPAQMHASIVALINNDPKLNAAQKTEMLAKADKALPAAAAQVHALLSDPSLMDEMIAELVPMYAETYTLDEIRQMSAFYASPVGQKMMASMPQLMARSMEVSNRIMMPRIQKLMAQSQQDLMGK